MRTTNNTSQRKNTAKGKLWREKNNITESEKLRKESKKEDII